MTYEESYKYWKNRYEVAKDFIDPEWEMVELREHRERCEHMKNASEALEKQIPKNVNAKYYALPIYDENKAYVDGILMVKATCPICGNTLVDGEIDLSMCEYIHYCENCGQALEWKEETE